MSELVNVTCKIRAAERKEPPAAGGGSAVLPVCWVQDDSGSTKFQWIPIAVLIAAAPLYSLSIRRPLGASEAYSALAALQPSLHGVFSTALAVDPGKPLLYHVILHWFSNCFGNNEASLRAMSVLFGLASVALTYMLADELFGPRTGAAAALLWAFSPLAVLFAGWARMYSMFIAFALAHLLFMAKLRREPSLVATIMGGLLGAAMLYTHLGGALVLMAEGAMVVRDFWLRGRSNSWPALILALALFCPFLPVAASQGNSLFFGHWLDWIGAHHHQSTAFKLICALPIAAVGLWLVFAPEARENRNESCRWCAAIVLIPTIVMVGISILVRPMFQVRYLAPCWALAAIVAAHFTGSFQNRARRLAPFGILTLFLILVPIEKGLRNDPWKDIADRVESSSLRGEPVVFEAGFFGASQTIEGPANGFPEGYYRVPFDFYFRGANPRVAIPGSNATCARALLAEELKKRGGIWLVSGKSKPEAMKELPDPSDLLLSEINFGNVLLFHLKRAATGAQASAPGAPSGPSRLQCR